MQLANKLEGMDSEIRTLRKDLGIADRPEHKYPDEIEKEQEQEKEN